MGKIRETVIDALISYKKNDVDLEQATDMIMWEVNDALVGENE